MVLSSYTKKIILVTYDNNCTGLVVLSNILTISMIL